ncbi:hypothetical protein D7X87_26345, partial [bacterium D16-54]
IQLEGCIFPAQLILKLFKRHSIFCSGKKIERKMLWITARIVIQFLDRRYRGESILNFARCSENCQTIVLAANNIVMQLC